MYSLNKACHVPVPDLSKQQRFDTWNVLTSVSSLGVILSFFKV